MKKISVSEAKIGLELARPVMFKGSVLLDTGTILTEEYLRSLKKRNIMFIYVEQKSSENIEDIVKIDNDEISKEYIERIEKFNFSKGNIEELQNIIIELGNLQSKLSVPVLLNLIRRLPESQEKIKIFCIDSLKNFPKDIINSSELVTLLSIEKSQKVRNRIFDLLTENATKDIVDIFFAGIKRYSMKELQKISDVCLQFDSDMVVNIALKYMKEHDETGKRFLMNILENFVDSKKYAEFSKIYLGINVDTNQLSKKENIRHTEKASEKFSIPAVNNVSIDSVEELEKIDAEKVYRVKEDEVIKPQIKEVISFSEKDKSNINTVFKKIYNETISDTEEIFVDLRAGKRIVENKMEEMVSKMIIQLRENMKSAFELISNNTLDNYILSHSINSSYVSLLIGMLDGWDEEKLMILGTSALLHDVGMVKMKNIFWNEPRALNDLEMFDIKKHTIFGIDSLTSSTRFPSDVAYVAYQHHERLDGSGYPKGRKKNLINEYSQVVMIADVFTAMISTRVYRKKHSIDETMHYFLKEAKEKFNQKYVSLLLDFIQKNIQLENPDILVPSKKQKILVIDDNKDITNIVINSLSKYYNVSAYNEPLRALEEIENISPDLVIVDLMMPNMDGFSVCDALRVDSKFSRIPILIMTIKKDKSSVLTAMKYNVSGYVTKPFTKNDLLQKVGAALN